jgi:hypothetical protein
MHEALSLSKAQQGEGCLGVVPLARLAPDQVAPARAAAAIIVPVAKMAERFFIVYHLSSFVTGTQLIRVPMMTGSCALTMTV